MQAATAQTNASMNSAVPQPLAGAIAANFGNYTAFRTKMATAGAEVFGSGEESFAEAARAQRLLPSSTDSNVHSGVCW